MIALEMKNGGATVRVHDDLCCGAPEERILSLERLLGKTYKRRMLEEQRVIQDT